MKKPLHLAWLAAGLAVVCVCLAAWNDSAGQAVAPQSGESSLGMPVEPDVHEFMEYVFEPTYKRLQAGLAAEPANNRAWAGVKSDALILAEGGNLILLRRPEKDVQDWSKHAVEVRSLGGQLYAAAKKRDFTESRKQYEAMLSQCNTCHTQFADGEHQLTP